MSFKILFGLFLGFCKVLKVDNGIDRVSVPSPIAIDILMDAMVRDRAPVYLFSV